MQQLVTAPRHSRCPALPGLPELYGSFAYDADRQNLDAGTPASNFFLTRPRLMLNLAGTYYKPQDQSSGLVQTDLNRREDSIFELFSVSELLQFRGGMRYPFTPHTVGLRRLLVPALQSKAGTRRTATSATPGCCGCRAATGWSRCASSTTWPTAAAATSTAATRLYENQVYKRILFRTKLDVAYYDKRNNSARRSGQQPGRARLRAAPWAGRAS